MIETSTIEDNERDNVADAEIKACLSIKAPQSFFLYAGAGSGKTRSLKEALTVVLETYGDTLRRQGRQVGVITFTNAARDEILRRVKHDPIFHVSTIHSFAWTLLEGRTRDIRQWIAKRLPNDIEGRIGKLQRARTEQSQSNHQLKISSLEKRLDGLEGITQFTYNPNGDNFGKDSLSHGEVIAMSSDFLTGKPMLQKIVLSHYPFLLIDESQDTLKEFMQALLKFEEAYKGQIALGLFGDTMQRIYPQGMRDLTESIPTRWKKPKKQMNHRSRERIIRLANAIRADADGWSQLARADKVGGHVAAYIVPADVNDMSETEIRICKDFAERTRDAKWAEPEAVKTLTLEHHMAAERLGFKDLFSAIDPTSTLRTGFRDGSLAPLRLFTDRILPLVEAHQENDLYAVMSILRANSPLLSKAKLQSTSDKTKTSMEILRMAVSDLMAHFNDDDDPKCSDVLSTVIDTRLFSIPGDLLSAHALCTQTPSEDSGDVENNEAAAWRKFLDIRFSEIPIYKAYVNNSSQFGTHQGVKGLEFPRIMIIIDDANMRFKGAVSYEKLLGAKSPSKTDTDNQSAGKETSYDRTRRLLYVTCTRAKDSLALVIYSDNPDAIEKTFLGKGWFTKDEIITSVLS